MRKPQPWNPSDATEAIRTLGQNEGLTLSYSGHFKDRLAERDLLIGDVRFVLKNGFVFDAPENATQPGLFRYKIETRSPNSHNRTVRIVLIPDYSRSWIKLVTVMWTDE